MLVMQYFWVVYHGYPTRQLDFFVKACIHLYMYIKQNTSGQITCEKALYTMS